MRAGLGQRSVAHDRRAAAPDPGNDHHARRTRDERIDHGGNDVDVDGRGILVVEATRSVDQQDGVVFVENWLEEFSQDR